MTSLSSFNNFNLVAKVLEIAIVLV